MSYARALTRFSSEGHLIQVDNANTAAEKENTVLAIRGRNSKCIVAAVEKRDAMKLQKQGESVKICQLDKHIMCTYSGLQADARVLIEKAQVECQNYRLANEDPITVENIAKYVANFQAKYTRHGGVRPFGVTTLICGFDKEIPYIFETTPEGKFIEWIASSAGRFHHPVLEYLEKKCDINKFDDMLEDSIIRIAIGSIREITDARARNIEVAILKPREKIRFIDPEEIEKIVKEIDNPN